MERILVPVDFSECSKAAVNAAVAIASRSGGKLYFLHLHQTIGEIRHVPVVHAESGLSGEKELTGLVKEKIRALVDLAERAGVSASPILAINDRAEWIEDYVLPYQIDFVVMGSHGNKGIKEALIGSTTQKFVRHCPVPVLVIKNMSPFSVNNIVFASDFSIDLVKPFKPVMELTRMWNATLNLLFVNTPHHFVETHEVLFNMKRFMHQFRNINYHCHVQDARDEETGIHEFVVENNVDLIAMTTHGRTGFMKILTHSIAEDLINHEDHPLLVMNIKSLLQRSFE